MKILKVGEVIIFHEKIIQRTGGSSGIRDIGLLESALNKPLLTFGGEDLYPDILDKISTTTYSVINNHPMTDGNKRLGVMVMWVLLKLNNITIKYSQEELIELGLEVARNKFKEVDIKNWIQQHII